MKTIETTHELLDCGHLESEHGELYGTTSEGKRHCYACCAEQDKKQMREQGKICLYLTTKPDGGQSPAYGDATITNWPGSLKLAGRYHKGGHNIAGSRYDCWFKFEGKYWHGVQYGEMTQIVHCRRLKG